MELLILKGIAVRFVSPLTRISTRIMRMHYFGLSLIG